MAKTKVEVSFKDEKVIPHIVLGFAAAIADHYWQNREVLDARAREQGLDWFVDFLLDVASGNVDEKEDSDG